MGKLVEIKKYVLGQVTSGAYSKGYSYMLDDERHPSILLLKPVGEGKHIYVVPEFEKIKTTEIAKAIYALLHEQGKNRKVVYIKDKKGGTNEFFFNDSVIDIFRKLTKIDEINLLKD